MKQIQDDDVIVTAATKIVAGEAVETMGVVKAVETMGVVRAVDMSIGAETKVHLVSPVSSPT
jgi:hypothetical protein